MADETMRGRVTAFCDGGSRGNPGPAGYGVFVQAENGSALAELSEFLGVKTNNVAEYSGLVAALGWAVEHGVSELRVVSDSELMVKQMKGQYRVKSPELLPLFEEAKRRAATLGKFEMQHVLRGKNKEADRLANEAMDRGTGKGAAGRFGVAKPVSADLASAGAGQGVAAGPGTVMFTDNTAKPVARTAMPPGTSVLAQPQTALSTARSQSSLPLTSSEILKEVTGFVKNGVVHLVEGELPEGTFVRILPARR